MAAASTSGTPAGMREMMKKATTEMLILFLLRHKEMYTYEMMSTIERISDGRLTFNTLYLAIYRLQKNGQVEEARRELSEGNRVRIYFRITGKGRTYYEGLLEQYHLYTGAINDLLEQDATLDLESQDDNAKKIELKKDGGPDGSVFTVPSGNS